jgi:hypothetical protein
VKGTTGLRLRGKRLILTSPNPFAFTGPANFPRPKWEFNVRKVVVDVGGNASIYHSAFRIEAVPVFYFPFATHPVEGLPRPTGLLIPNVGSSSLKGTILGDSVFWSINRSMDVTAGVEYFTRRGWAPQAEFRARPSEDSYLDVNYFGGFDLGTGSPSARFNFAPGQYRLFWKSPPSGEIVLGLCLPAVESAPLRRISSWLFSPLPTFAASLGELCG